MEQVFNELKQKYNYSDELIEELKKILVAFIEVIGEENKDLIINALFNSRIIEFTTVEEASEKLRNLYNDGKSHRVGAQATGGGFLDDHYIVKEDGTVIPNFVIGYSSTSAKKIQSLVHELCHAISSQAYVKNGKMYTFSGFQREICEIENNSKGKGILEQYEIFNEIITENLTMQVMDSYDKTVKHEPDAYNAMTEQITGVFRDEDINPIIIDDYLNHTCNYIPVLSEKISQEKYIRYIDNLYQYFTQEDTELIAFLDYLKTINVSEFMNLFMTYFVNYRNYDKETLSTIRHISRHIVDEFSYELINNPVVK